MEFIRSFKRLGKEDARIAGGKGASLGEMTQAGIPVPPGFVILAGTFDRFVEEAGLQSEIEAALDAVKPEEMSSVERASGKIQALIIGQEMPEDIAKEILEHFSKLDAEFVAVRSSATAEDSSTAAWAGQLDTFLNTTEESLLENVQKCWASLFTPRAIFYRIEKGMRTHKISVAVVVQKMVQSEVSGIAFSVHPVTEDYNQMIIEAGLGLGEALVSGQVTPDSYVIEKEQRKILEKNISYQSKALWRAESGGNEWRDLSETEGTKPALSDEQALQLADLVLHIENHYGFPCDIEWAFEVGQFFITQSRPITTLTQASPNANQVQLPAGDWFKFIERTGHFYVYALFAETDSRLLEQQVGLGFSSSLYRFQSGLGANYRNPNDYDAVNKRFLELITSNDPRLAPLAQKGVQYNAEADALMAKYKDPKKLTNIPPSQFRSDHQLLLNMFLYGCTVPYLVLDASDYGKALDVWLPEYDERIKPFEPLRGVAKYFECEEMLMSQYRKLAAATNIDPSLLVFLMPNEFIAIFEGTPTVTQEELQKRKEWCIFWTTDGGKSFTFSYDSNIAHKYSFLRDPKPVGDNELSGAIAFKGKVRGRVSIVTTTDETDKCKQGDILVSQSTNPTLMPAILRCAGIVTDEGGMASHASIIARELKKPAVVGTKFATQISKTAT